MRDSGSKLYTDARLTLVRTILTRNNICTVMLPFIYSEIQVAILSLLVWIYQTSRHKINLWTQIDLIKSYLKLSVKKKKKKRKHKFSFFFSPFLISGETTVPISSQTKQWMLSIRITHPNRCSCTWLTKLYIAHWPINQCKLHRIWLTSEDSIQDENRRIFAAMATALDQSVGKVNCAHYAQSL